MVAPEYAKDPLYHGAAVRVTDRDGNEVAVIPVSDRCRPSHF